MCSYEVRFPDCAAGVGGRRQLLSNCLRPAVLAISLKRMRKGPSPQWVGAGRSVCSTHSGAQEQGLPGRRARRLLCTTSPPCQWSACLGPKDGHDSCQECTARSASIIKNAQSPMSLKTIFCYIPASLSLCCHLTHPHAHSESTSQNTFIHCNQLHSSISAAS